MLQPRVVLFLGQPWVTENQGFPTCMGSIKAKRLRTTYMTQQGQEYFFLMPQGYAALTLGYYV